MTHRRVAVIGAGAAGLAASRELRQEGHGVVVFECGGCFGGAWIYSATVESDPLGLDSNRQLVHSSLYASLRTNIPRESMGFYDYPFSAAAADAASDDSDRRRFPGHREVRRYLEDFARDFDLMGLIRFWSRVVCVEIEGDGRWKVVWRPSGGDGGSGGGGGGGGDESEVFDAVVVCVGHYSEPRVAEIPGASYNFNILACLLLPSGIESWPGKQIHSHNYKVPEPLRDQVVVIVGNSASAADISKEIADFAKEVHIASRSSPAGAPLNEPGYDNVWLHSMIERARIDGTVLFQDGSLAHADVIMHCTGYKYHFPFLKTNGIVTVDDNRVGPLYKHVFPPLMAPYLSFIGLTYKIIPFPLFQMQSKWVAGVLSERILLPTKEEMMEDVESLYSEMESSGWPKRYTHNITNYHFEYVDWLAGQCRHPPVEEWRKLMYYANRKNRAAKPTRYRHEWDDDDLVVEAHEHFKKLAFFSS